MTDILDFQAARAPLLISVPHAGTALAPGMRDRLTLDGLARADTDWFVDRLYEPCLSLGAGMIVARYSRYVVDLNRPPDDAPLYATSTTGLVPVNTFEGQPLYRQRVPDGDEIAARLAAFHSPYHERIGDELKRIRGKHGKAILIDAHSIRSRVPRLFDGSLPDLNLGSYDGRSAGKALIRRAWRSLSTQPGFSSVLDGRFKGGYITRHYGRPDQGVHALQLEMAQRAYMDEDLRQWEDSRAAPVMRALKAWLADLLEWCDGNG
ncbi:MAG: N-formylglutamate deformylase [Xanthomonadales bacterium]|nr:N-formylglutamate deformylase [Xanthomonadales bacterium]